MTLHEGSATAMPFADATFDLIVSNLGVNNFDDRAAAIRECRRVAKPGATLALTTNLQGHMREFYDVFAEVVRDDAEASKRLRDHIEHRATVASVRELLETGGFTVTRVIEREVRHALRERHRAAQPLLHQTRLPRRLEKGRSRQRARRLRAACATRSTIATASCG